MVSGNHSTGIGIFYEFNREEPDYDETIKKPVVIERNVWIGINVTIVPGVTIGEGAIVGAGSVVAKDIPSLAIVGSAPLRIIRYRDNDHYTRLDRARRYGGVNGELYHHEDDRQ